VSFLVVNPVGVAVLTNLSALWTRHSPDIVGSLDVSLERPGVEEGLAALVAHQCLLVAVVLDEVSFQLRVAQELLGAVFALLLRPLFVNADDVLVEAVLAAVGLGTFRTLECLPNLVFVALPVVVLQVCELGEGLLTMAAIKRSRLVVNGLPVSGQRDGTEESQAASLADEVEDAAVGPEVVTIQASLETEFLSTFVALVLLQLVVEVVSVINELLPGLERLVAGVATKFADNWFVAGLRVRVLAAVLVQLSLVGEI